MKHAVSTGTDATGEHSTVMRLVHEFARRIDFAAGVGVELLFTEDGYLEFDGRSSRGRPEIMRAYAARRARGPRTARHVVTNVRIFGDDRGVVGGQSIMLVFGADGHPPFDFASPIAVADVFDVYSLVDNEVLIARRVITPVFVDSERPVVPPLGLR